ncbi:hypothetical protein [Piscibacillus salipiscarius]|uniref:Uncharacterized protein n=1 Tax=Piscibacillus salipiscarius TaxID=299480 RepID=A0ABW5Q960_9BACI|nr:hypothetical protein [Piscibacillus salipiscarius]
MNETLKEFVEDYKDFPLWVYLLPILGAIVFFPLMTLFLIVLGA